MLLWKVCFCERADVPEEIRNAHVVVPFMAKLDQKILEHASSLQLIIQYGVGLEGVDSSQVDNSFIAEYIAHGIISGAPLTWCITIEHSQG